MYEVVVVWRVDYVLDLDLFLRLFFEGYFCVWVFELDDNVAGAFFVVVVSMEYSDISFFQVPCGGVFVWLH